MKNMKQIIYKVPNGKLIKLFINFDGEQIKEIKLTGDFFVYPEEKITVIEKFLVGKAVTNIEAIKNDFQDLLNEEDIEFFGIDIDSIFLTISKAYEN